MASSEDCHPTPKATGTIRLTYDGIIRFHGETSDGEPVGYTGTYAPGLSSTVDRPAKLYGDDIKDLPGPHTLTGYVGTGDLKVIFEDVSITITAKLDPHAAQRVSIAGSGRGNIGMGDALPPHHSS